MNQQFGSVAIHGYCDVPSAAPGEIVRFYVSCDEPGAYESRLMRLIHGDTNPKGPGYKEEEVPSAIDGVHQGRFQRTQFGSFVQVEHRGELKTSSEFGLHAFIWPTSPARSRQGILSCWDDQRKAGWALTIDNGSLVFCVGDGSGQIGQVISDRPLFREVWYSVSASWDPAAATLVLRQKPVVNRANSIFGPIVPLDSRAEIVARSPVVPVDAGVPLII